MECPPTYGVPRELVVGLIAGGYDCMFRAAEGAEDSAEAGVADLQAISLGGGIQLDAQIAAMFLLAILWYIPHRQRTLNRSTVGIS